MATALPTCKEVLNATNDDFDGGVVGGEEDDVLEIPVSIPVPEPGLGTGTGMGMESGTTASEDSNEIKSTFNRLATAFFSRMSSQSFDKSSSPRRSPKRQKTPSPERVYLDPLQLQQQQQQQRNTGSRSRTPSPRQTRSNSIRLEVPTVATKLSPLTSQQPSRAYLGAIPRHNNMSSSIESEEMSSSCSTEERRCFCGYYSESTAYSNWSDSTTTTATTPRKPGRCKFCRSRAKYVPGQRSFDAARIFGRRRERTAPRRAVSEDRRSDGQTAEDTSTSNSSATTASSSFDRPSPSSRSPFFFSTPPFLRRQERLDVDPPSPNLLTVPTCSPLLPPPTVITTIEQPPTPPPAQQQYFQIDHGLRTPPAPPPPSSLPIRQLRMQLQNSVEDDQQSHPHRNLTHRMAHEMPEYLVPPPRTAILGRAHTDPTSLYDNYLLQQQQQQMRQNHLRHPTSPPPAYSEVIREPVIHTPQSSGGSSRTAPPSYEEALQSRVADMRLSCGLRSLSEERTAATSGLHASSTATSSGYGIRNRSSRGSLRPLIRSSRAEEIPDIYWEQAARELDFCTCRKCQARYRQYFEEEPDPTVGDAMIPMETQVLMQEVLTDGIAFCSLM